MSRRLSKKSQTALQQFSNVATSFRTYTMVKTGRICHALPWNCGGPRPWRDGYTRVLIPVQPGHPHPSTQIVRNDHLSPIK